MHEHHAALEWWPQIVLAAPFAVLFLLYNGLYVISLLKSQLWPVYRLIVWNAGLTLCLISVIGPLAQEAHSDFTAHMTGHLLLGMAGPLLLVLGAPITLLLRSISTDQARRVTAFLKKPWLRVLTYPLVPALLNVGGLWLLYTTSLYTLMHEYMLLHILVHLHVFLAGYFFTASIIYIDPMPHRVRFLTRALVLTAALAGHGILSKYLYANPPAGVPAEQARSGSMLMYYGGDAVDLLIIIILCSHWYHAARPRSAAAKQIPTET
ncbi:cytochrome c oxidase assembly protein [Sinobaca sp. H24]|uniref:cytochrome c oxidase assembly protein n=1 Tax=Sinobaca sp. H24 TaxID=2923376 RepID=UPI00207954C6|nr:cytochrome c oxidase assembly protein [Sinobaca sp. H24]